MEEYITDERLDPTVTAIQGTGTAVDMPIYLLAAARTLGITKFTMEDLGVMLYRLTVKDD